LEDGRFKAVPWMLIVLVLAATTRASSDDFGGIRQSSKMKALSTDDHDPPT
jgi:hypothetical protein